MNKYRKSDKTRYKFNRIVFQTIGRISVSQNNHGQPGRRIKTRRNFSIGRKEALLICILRRRRALQVTRRTKVITKMKRDKEEGKSN